MAKKVRGATTTMLAKTYGIDKQRRGIHCDDGSTYVFERATDGRVWNCVARYDSNGRAASPNRLPAAVEAHMDGFTQSGPHGRDGKQRWA